MKILLQILTVLVGLEFFYIMYLETIATTSKKTAQIFKMSQEELSQKNVIRTRAFITDSLASWSSWPLPSLARPFCKLSWG